MMQAHNGSKRRGTRLPKSELWWRRAWTGSFCAPGRTGGYRSGARAASAGLAWTHGSLARLGVAGNPVALGL